MTLLSHSLHVKFGIEELVFSETKMAKISPASIKYMIHASFNSEGPVEKPDVIGAIFGQTEGLLGADLEMRELQKEGRIGRIEVELNSIDGKSLGEIQVPSALDKSETTIIAATLETINKIGPTEAQIQVLKIEDVRGNKREYIIERAKKLLEKLDNSGEVKMSKTLVDETRAAKIQEYGEEKLPAGDLSEDEVIVVEGRADVVNLLKNRVNNVVGMNGTKLPKEISVLGEDKELTLFIDGDRGGKLIAKNVIENAKIVYVASAPDGKEVEELTGKEILMALRKKMSVGSFLRKENISISKKKVNVISEKSDDDIKPRLNEIYKKIKGNKEAVFLDDTMEEIKSLGISGLGGSLARSRSKVYVVIVDGAATASLVRACDEKGVSYLAAKNFSYVKDAKVKLISI